MERNRPVRSPATAFVIRIWTEGDEKIRGEIEHLESGERRLFVDYSSLLSFIDSMRLQAAAQ
jgi:hypothetical protein